MKRVAMILFAAAVVLAQQPGGGSPPPAPQSTPGRYVGVASCVNSGCHGATQPLNASHVLQNEYYTWLNKDTHARTYNVLFSERSARIARNMRLKKRAYEENVCLDCHTTNVPAKLVEGAVDKEDGVQCEQCHGPAGGWRAEHTMEGWTHEQSVARGMIDLAKISNRAGVCVQCHVGTGKKEVDHELIASGHPLLAFELDNYTESMPPHWTAGRDTHGVRAWAAGQVVAFRDSLDNLARHARGDKWPEFSDMSCFNCHHSLKTSGWRQERGWPDRAGLPAWSPQHWAALRLLVDRISPGARTELDPLVADIALQVARMNDSKAVAASAERARRIADSLVAKADSLRWTDGDIRALMAAIASDRAFIERSDVHSAEQAALALQSLASALTRRNPKLLKSSMTSSIDALFNEIQDREAYEPSRFAQKLAALKATL